jgi:hypothetical protein
MTVFDIIKKYLRDNGMAGLVQTETECGCSVDDLSPCTDGPCPDCEPARIGYDGLFYPVKEDEMEIKTYVDQHVFYIEGYVTRGQPETSRRADCAGEPAVDPEADVVIFKFLDCEIPVHQIGPTLMEVLQRALIAEDQALMENGKEEP